MNIFLFICALLFLMIGIGVFVYNSRLLKQIQSTKISLTQEEQKKKNLEEELRNLQSEIATFNSAISSLKKHEEELQKNAGEKAERTYLDKMQNFEKQFQIQVANKEYELQQLEQQLIAQTEKLKTLEDTQLAYIQAQQKEKEMRERADYFRLMLSAEDIDDINELRKLQKSFSKKEVIDKLIWDVYYKPAYDILMPHLFKTSKDISGIYRMTDITTGLAYIGQSVNIKERFRQHIKASLAYDRSANKLYQCMKDSGQYNFTFEILEEAPRDKLNEREAYWINFYKTKEYGLNSQKGNS